MKISSIMMTVVLGVSSSSLLSNFALAESIPPKLDRSSGNETNFMSYFTPAFDYDGDGCYPSVLVGKDNTSNGGLGIGGHQNGHCRDRSDLYQSNTYGRLACYSTNNTNLNCALMYALSTHV
jgi:hypothetical protein